MKKQKLIIVVGPTAVGKTQLSIDLAKAFHGEIISGDSMQIYRGMDIGTAKIQPNEMEGIPHYLIDIKEPDESFSAAEFQKLVREKINEIIDRGFIPIIVGGTGLYIQSVLYDYHFTEMPGDTIYRDELESRVESGGGDELYKQLELIDPESALNIHPNNSRRVIRALEIFHSTGKTMSEHQRNQPKTILYDAVVIGLSMDRQKLYSRIDDRVDLMIEAGLIKEVKSIYDQGIRNVQAVQAIGYKELYEYFDGIISHEEAIEQLKQNSRRYAKRQLTWFRNKMDVVWFDMSNEGEHFKKTGEIIDFIAGKLQLKSNT